MESANLAIRKYSVVSTTKMSIQQTVYKSEQYVCTVVAVTSTRSIGQASVATTKTMAALQILTLTANAALTSALSVRVSK